MALYEMDKVDKIITNITNYEYTCVERYIR